MSERTASSAAEERQQAPRIPRSLSALARSMRLPGAWIPFALVPLALALAPALGWIRWFESPAAQRYSETELLPALDETFRFDHRLDLADLAASTGALGAWLALLAVLLGCACAGGALALLAAPAGERSIARWATGATQTWWRFVRVVLVELALLAALGWLLYGLPWRVLVLELWCGLPGGDPQEFASEASAVRIGWLRDGLYALGFAGIGLAAVHARTRIALGDSRSAFVASARSAWFLLRHPLRAVLPAALLGGAHVFAVFALGAFSNARNHAFETEGAGFQIGVLLVCTLLAILIGAIARVAQYALALELLPEFEPRLASTRDWPPAVGAPGGAQYPIDGDEFGVSV
ncbi:MAG: hypothetical protein FJ299_00810 [Planctomycetes bacterium]|nr:hypothetical protein [Planctomycetota bacterium]